MQAVINLRNKLPDSVLKYLRLEYSEEENLPLFGKDVKIYPVEEVSSCLNDAEEVLTNWGVPSNIVNGVAKKDISFEWKASNPVDTKVVEVPPEILLRKFN